MSSGLEFAWDWSRIVCRGGGDREARLTVSV